MLTNLFPNFDGDFIANGENTTMGVEQILQNIVLIERIEEIPNRDFCRIWFSKSHYGNMKKLLQEYKIEYSLASSNRNSMFIWKT